LFFVISNLVQFQRSVLSLPVKPLSLTGLGFVGGRGGCGRGAGRGSVPLPLAGWATASSSVATGSDLILLLLSTPFEGCNSLSGLGGRSGRAASAMCQKVKRQHVKPGF
jgi:hypothetical protein